LKPKSGVATTSTGKTVSEQHPQKQGLKHVQGESGVPARRSQSNIHKNKD